MFADGPDAFGVRGIVRCDFDAAACAEKHEVVRRLLLQEPHACGSAA